jgi:hypothetical protein
MSHSGFRLERSNCLNVKYEYGKSSPICLQLIQIKIWKMTNSVHSWIHTLKDIWDLGAKSD